ENHSDRRGLPGAVRPEEAEDLAALDRERQPVDADHRAEVLREAVELDRGRRHRFSLVSSRSADAKTSVAGLALPSPAITISPGSDGISNCSGATVADVSWLTSLYETL